MYRQLITALGLVSAFVSPTTSAWAGDVPLFGATPDWVIDAGKISSEDAKADGLILIDRQQKVDQDRVWAYTDIAFRATSAEQLSNLGRLTLSWHPDKGDITVHRVEIVRGDQIIDVLKGGNKFTILRREQNLEQQWINGILSATIQIEGLKIGDILRAASSISFADPALAGNVEIAQPLIVEPVKIVKSSLRLLWPNDRPFRWRISTKGVQPQISKFGNYAELRIAQPLPKQPDKPESAPVRFVPPDFFEASSFAKWEDVSKAAARHYATEGLIAPGTALAERVAKIVAGSADPLVRTAGAVRMVQDEIRYLFNGQTQGNYVPQKPAETWEKRYGDCKAKTILLVAILRSMGIEADAALVHAQQGDLLGSRLPSLGAFNHVITRAVIGGKIYWLDGTVLGTRLADLGDPPPFYYALPVRAKGSGLETISYAAPARPLVIVDKEIDTTAGLALPKLYKITLALRGADVVNLRQGQAVLEGKKLNDAIDAVVLNYLPDSTVHKRSLSFDDEAGSAQIIAEGITNLNWQQEGDRRQITIDTIFSDFDIATDRNRPAWKDVAVSNNVPNFYELHYHLRLPKNGKGFTLENPKTMMGRFAGLDMSMNTRFEGNLFELDQAWKTSETEVAAANIPVEREKIARVKAGEIHLIAPQDYPPQWREARDARAAGLHKRLEKAYAENIAQDVEDAEGYINRARFLDGIDDKAGAIADLTKVLGLRADASTFLWRARLLESTDTKKALADIESARLIDPASSSVVGQLTDIYVKQLKFDEALAAIESSMPLQKDRTDMLILKAEVLAKAGKAEQALGLINKANLDKPGNADLLNSRCWVKGIANVELETALKDCTKAIELAEYPATILDSRGLIYLRMHRYEEAIADLDAALRLSPGLPQSLFVRGVARSFIGATAESQKDLLDARTIRSSVEVEYSRMGVKPKP